MAQEDISTAETPTPTPDPLKKPVDPLVLNARGGDHFFSGFNNVATSIPGTVFVLILFFGICYGMRWYLNHLMVSREVAKYVALDKSSTGSKSDPVLNRANSGLIETTIQKSNTNTITTAMKFNITLDPAGVGFDAQGQGNNTYSSMVSRVSSEQPPAISEAGEEEEKGDTWVEHQAPVFAMPGFLLMDFSADVRLKGKIAEGGGGVIYKADLINADFLKRLDNNSAIVVKVLKPLPHMAFNELKTIVFQEIAIMHALCHHPNIITLVGFTEEPLSIIMKQYDRNLFNLVMALPEYALNDSEYEAMRSMVKTDSKLKKGLLVKGFEFLPEINLHVAYGIAAGMAEMHLLGILHRDLKSANVLLEYRAGTQTKSPWMNNPTLSSLSSKISGSMGQNSLAGGVGWGNDDAGKPFCPVNPVVCDFGLAKMIKKNGEFDLSAVAVKGMRDTTAVGISYRYAAPEAFNRMYQKTGNYTDEGKPVDVFAFAVMVWEMLERKVPFHKLSNKEVESKIKMGERPAISSQHRDPNKPLEGNKHFSVILRTIEASWKQDPRERPSFDELKKKLKPFWLGPREIRDAASAAPPGSQTDGVPFYNMSQQQQY